MANELTVQVKATFAQDGTSVTFPDGAHQSITVSVTGKNFVQNRETVTTSEKALALGDTTAGGYFVAVNRDATNYVSLRQGTGTTNFVRLLPGEVCCFRIDAASTAPYAIANTASVQLEYLFLPA